MYRDTGEVLDIISVICMVCLAKLAKHEKERTKMLGRDNNALCNMIVAKYDIQYHMQYKKLRSNVSCVS